MKEEIFRKKSLDRIKSPESLDDYIRVSNPGIWLLLVSVIVLLAGACVWGVFGHIESVVDTTVRVENGTAYCFIASGEISSVSEGMNVRFGDYEAVISGDVQTDGQTYVCALLSEQTIPDGFYDGTIVVSEIRPISFVLN